MLELIMNLGCVFTDADKEKCKSIVYRTIELASVARREGLLALDKEMNKEQNFFLKTAIDLVTDGTDPQLIKQILKHLILADQYTGSELLSRLIITEGTLAIQMGENPRVIVMKLGAMLGEKYLAEMNEELGFINNSMNDVYRFLSSIRDKKVQNESIPFERLFSSLNDKSMQRVLRELDDSTLIRALNGCSFMLITRVFDNLSVNRCNMLYHTWEGVKQSSCVEYSSRAQESIMRTIAKLEKEGEIIISHNNIM